MSINGKGQAGYFEVQQLSDANAARDKQNWLVFNCPCGCGKTRKTRLFSAGERGQGGAGYHWNGSRLLPSVEPAFGPLPVCGFRGYLRDGVWNGYGNGPELAKDCYSGGASAS